MFGLFPEKQQCKEMPIDERFAKHLFDALQKKRAIMSKPKLPFWAREFTILRETVDKADVGKVLYWYCQNIKKPFVPLAFSAKAFRLKFPQIELAMQRDIGSDFEISDEARNVLRRIQNLSWPKIKEDQLLQCIQISLNNYQEFIQKLQSFEVSCTFMKRAEFLPVKDLFRFSANWLNGKTGSPESFVQEWMVSVHKDVANWKDWSGDIIKQAFHHEHKRFKARGRSWALEYCSDPSRWDQLMERIYAEQSN